MIYAQYLQSICSLLAETRGTERAPVNRSIELQLGEVKRKQRGKVRERLIYLPRIY
jgi:hypothetical protein